MLAAVGRSGALAVASQSVFATLARNQWACALVSRSSLLTKHLLTSVLSRCLFLLL